MSERTEYRVGVGVIMVMVVVVVELGRVVVMMVVIAVRFATVVSFGFFTLGLSRM